MTRLFIMSVLLASAACAPRSNEALTNRATVPLATVLLQVEGIVRSDGGDPIAGAEVGLQDGGQLAWRPLGQTDAQGRFTINHAVVAGLHSSGSAYQYLAVASVGGLRLASASISVPPPSRGQASASESQATDTCQRESANPTELNGRPTVRQVCHVELRASLPYCSNIASSTETRGPGDTPPTVTQVVTPVDCPFGLPGRSGELPPAGELPVEQKDPPTISSVTMPPRPVRHAESHQGSDQGVLRDESRSRAYRTRWLSRRPLLSDDCGTAAIRVRLRRRIPTRVAVCRSRRAHVR